jgi:glycosyltransferase involved in cell wall biosynthesis
LNNPDPGGSATNLEEELSMTAYNSASEDGARSYFNELPPKVSLVIPAHNEERRLSGTLAAYGRRMRERFEEGFEILVVANGCSDGTVAVASRVAAGDPQIRVVEIEEAVGKGGAVLEGFRRAQGAAVAFADADGATAPESLVNLFEELDRSDVVIGSRRVEGSTITQPQPQARRFFGFMFAKTVKLLFGMPFSDTQCGAKALRGEVARRLCDVVSETRWTFDLDLLLCARLLGLKISEQPVIWADKEGSHLRYASTTWEVLGALWGMKRRQWRSLEVLPEPPVLGEATERAPEATETTTNARQQLAAGKLAAPEVA